LPTGRRPLTTDVLEAFIASRKARRCSPKYEAFLRYTLGHLARAHQRLPERPEPLEALLASLHVGDETQYDVWATMRRLYRWAAARLGVPDAMAVVEPPLVRPKVMRTLTDKQVDQLLWANQRRPRDTALLLLLLDTGARIGEVAAMTAQHVSDDTVRVPITGKVGEREIPISPRTAAALADLIAANRGVLWLGERGALSPEGLHIAVRRAIARAGLRGGPHLLRHTFGRLYILAGGDVFSLQRIMGHRNIETTNRYVALDLRDVRAQHEKFSPVARARREEARQLPLIGAVQ